jgi:hypothetical protein
VNRRLFLRSALVAGTGAIAGCRLPTGDLIVYPADAPELAAASVTPEGVWESCPWAGSPWLPYPGRASVQVEHSLGYAPPRVLVYLSFEASGADPALAAGDLARVVEVDATTLLVRSDTSAFFFARIVAW